MNGLDTGGAARRQEVRISNEKYRAGREVERSSKRFTRDLLRDEPPGLVLDIGCGTGLNAQHIRDMGHTVQGVDISPVAIERFSKLGFHGKVGDLVEGLPYDDSEFDYVFASEVIEHVVDTKFFLVEVSRVLKANGVLILSTPNSSFWAFRVLSVLGYTLTEMQHPGHVRFFSIRLLKRFLTDAGFGEISVSARHMYFIIGGSIGAVLSPVLKVFGFNREFRFKNGTYFWHLSRRVKNGGGFLADTIVVKTRKSG